LAEAVVAVPKRLDYLADRVEEVDIIIFFQEPALLVKDLLAVEVKLLHQAAVVVVQEVLEQMAIPTYQVMVEMVGRLVFQVCQHTMLVVEVVDIIILIYQRLPED
jgi:hypothetical protein